MATKRDQAISMDVDRALGRAYGEGFQHGVETADAAMRTDVCRDLGMRPGSTVPDWVAIRIALRALRACICEDDAGEILADIDRQEAESKSDGRASTP